jgi:eukaryotic-like serine/threonine-protein kinase
MPPLPPATGDAVVDLIRKAALADDDVLDAFVGQSGPLPPTASDTATRLIEAGILTPFQAKLILQGKYKGFRLGPYRILDQIGVGGMGQVFLAEHLRMQRRVALKVLPARKANPAELDRFYREARAAAVLDHPNIVRAYDIDHENNTHFLVLEYLEGLTLAERVAGGVSLPIAEACGYAVQAAAGLHHIHEMRIVHRDIKPENLLVNRDGVLKILDVGIARFFHDSDGSNVDHGALMGTADYIAPEQATACSKLDHRADIYSLGATLYHLVTGRPPFEGMTTAKLIAHQLHAVPPAHSVYPEVPEELSAIIEKMMAKSPEERFQSAADVIVALFPFASDVPGFDGLTVESHVPAEDVPEVKPVHDRKWLILGTAAAIVLSAILALIVFR